MTAADRPLGASSPAPSADSAPAVNAAGLDAPAAPTRLPRTMTVDEFFDRRTAMADRFGVDPRTIPAEAVWFLYDGPITDADRQRAAELLDAIGYAGPFGSVGTDDD